MRVFGIDCGSERTGFGVIETDGRSYQLLATGTIVTSARQSFETRLFTIAEGLREQIRLHRPDVIAIEEVFHAVNTRTAIKLSHVRGVALLTVAEAGLPLAEYSALAVKSSVVGYGRAEKHQVQQMVASLLKLSQPIASEDASDALAVAICHANHFALAAVR